MRYLSALLASALTVGLILAQTSTTTPASKSKTTSTKSKTTTTKSAAKPAPPKRYVQLQPTQQRYKEIQQALADRHYFDGPIDGNWGPQSIDSLKRFQHDEHLEEDGKIGSQSLIHLGLGPQRTAAAASPAPPAPPADTPQQ